MLQIFISIISVLAIIYIIPIIVYGFFSAVAGLKTPEGSPLVFLFSILVSKIGTAKQALLLVAMAVIMVSDCSAVQDDSKKGTGMQSEQTVEWVCGKFPDRITKLFESLDVTRPGMEKVSAAKAKQDWPEACKALLEYYKGCKSGDWLRKQKPDPGDAVIAEADKILDDVITAQLVPDKLQRLEGGGIDWSHKGPDNDSEWAYFLNRHYHIKKLLDAYLQTGNKAYVRCIDEHIRDWIIANSYPAKNVRTLQWRGLEVNQRLIHWSIAFYALQDVKEFTPAVRILMLSSIPEHAHYERHFHTAGNNHLTMEMNGLAIAAVCWPEFKDSGSWLDYGIKIMTEQIFVQVYPDGVQKELTNSYHRCTADYFQSFADLVSRSPKKIPDDYTKRLEQMWSYTAYVLRPDGCSLLNNDSDRTSYREQMLKLADIYNRPDWTWIASNGKQGEKPAGQPSFGYPWAGQLIMRSGYDPNAHWAFFDFGPMGVGHYHFDKLHISIAAYGRDLLVDSGRYTYRCCAGRSHVVSTAAHNSILIDGKGQKHHERTGSSPKEDFLIADEYDYARGTFDDGYIDVEGPATHTRAVAYLRNKCWIVVDRIESERPRTIQTLWHWNPECTVEKDGISTVSVDDAKGNLRIVPIGGLDWRLELVKGREEPDMQGWYSREYNHFVPTTAAVYSAKTDKTSTFAWLLVPGKGKVPAASGKITSIDNDQMSLTVNPDGKGEIRLSIALSGKPTVKIEP